MLEVPEAERKTPYLFGALGCGFQAALSVAGVLADCNNGKGILRGSQAPNSAALWLD